MPTIIPSLWFDGNGLEAAEFYVSIFPNSKIGNIAYYPENSPGPAGTVMTVDFVLDGQLYTVINGGPQFPFTEAISLLVDCRDQDEIDLFWEKLTDGGEEVQCGWLKDKFGVSWQVSAQAEMWKILGDPDKERSDRSMQAMFGMKKLDIAALRAAADG